MLTLFDGLRDVTIASVALRMVLAVVCGGIIGIESTSAARRASAPTF